MAAHQAPQPWDFPGKNTGVGCHFLLQCMKVKSQSEVAQSYPTLSEPMDCSLPGSSIHGIFPGKSTGVGCHCLLRIFRHTGGIKYMKSELPRGYCYFSQTAIFCVHSLNVNEFHLHSEHNYKLLYVRDLSGCSQIVENMKVK